MEGHGEVIVLVGLAILIFRPADVPTMARGAGRFVGAGLRQIRSSRKTITRALQEASEHPSTNFGSARENVSRSLEMFDKISHRLRREIEPLSFNPRQFVNIQPKRDVHPKSTATDNTRMSQPSVKIQVHTPIVNAVSHRKDMVSGGLKPIDPRTCNQESGADVVASVVEETAFAKQHARALGSEFPGPDPGHGP